MKKSTIFSILRFIFVTVWRLVLLAAALVALVCVGLHMTLQTLLCGPWETARNELTLTLLESEYTREIPGKYLDSATIDAICAVEHTLPAEHSDVSLITVNPVHTEKTAFSITTATCRAQVKLLTDPSQVGAFFTEGSNFAGFTSEGILMLSTSQQQGQALGRCGHILILNSQANEGLYAAASGYAPRTAIGQRADGTVILVTTDGWTKEHPGATYRDLIDIMTQFDAVNACIVTAPSEE